MYGPKHIITRHWRLILFAALIAGVAWAFYALRSILFPFLLGLLLAYILLPLVNWIQVRLPQRDGWLKINRILAIVIIFVLFIVMTGLFFLYIVTIVYNTISSLIANTDSILSAASDIITEWTGVFFRHVPPSMQEQVNRYIADVVTELVNAARNFVTQSITFIPATIGFVAGLITLPFFLFLILLDWETLRDGLYAGLSPRPAEYLRNIITITGDTMRQYFRGQLILSIIIGVLNFIGVTFLGIGFAPALGAISAIGEFIPWVGPVLSGIIAALVALATAPDKVVWVIVWFAVVQFAENNLLVPRIQGDIMHIHPAVVLVVLVVGTQLAGFWGLFFTLPITAIIIRVYDYFRHLSALQDARESVNTGQEDKRS